MKNIITKVTRLEVAIIIFPIISILSVIFLTNILHNIIGDPESIHYFSRIFFTGLVALLVLFSLIIYKVLEKVVVNSKKSFWWSFTMSILLILYITSFFHPMVQDTFFINIFLPSLFINAATSYIISSALQIAYKR